MVLDAGVAIRPRGTRGTRDIGVIFYPGGGLPREMPREIGAPKGRRRGARAPKKQAASVEFFLNPFLTLFGAPRRGAP